MKYTVEQLINELMPYKDFKLEASICDVCENKTGYGALNYRHFIVESIEIGHSEKRIILDLENSRDF